MVNKEQQIKELAWKHFKKRKKKEILHFLLILFIVYSAAGLVSQLGWICEPIDIGDFGVIGECKVPYEPSLPIWIMISGFITTGIWIIVGLVCWMKSNWENAKEEAEDEFKNLKAVRRRT